MISIKSGSVFVVMASLFFIISPIQTDDESDTNAIEAMKIALASVIRTHRGESAYNLSPLQDAYIKLYHPKVDVIDQIISGQALNLNGSEIRYQVLTQTNQVVYFKKTSNGYTLSSVMLSDSGEFAIDLDRVAEILLPNDTAYTITTDYRADLSFVYIENRSLIVPFYRNQSHKVQIMDVMDGVVYPLQKVVEPLQIYLRNPKLIDPFSIEIRKKPAILIVGIIGLILLNGVFVVIRGGQNRKSD